ncbi:MAG: diguanylate cyclase [Methylotenera sp.]|nr:diguanylate cyclase [Methylotenera sp.]
MSTSVKPLAQLLSADLHKLLEICVEQLNDAIVITEAEPIDKPGPRIVWANKIFYERNGYTPDEVIGQSPRILQGPETDRATLGKLRIALEKWRPIRSEILNYRKDGSTYWNEFQIVPIANEKGWFTHWVSIQRDVTERKKIEDKVRQLAFYDELTSLPNRRLLNDRLNQCIAASKRTGIYGALMFLDLDDFKPINDQYGHVAGDMLLIEVASRLKSCMREMDTVARFGGDEFVVMLGNLLADPLTSRSQAAMVAEKIRLALSEPYRFTLATSNLMVEHRCTVSIGLVVFNGSEGSMDDIMKWADVAMYQAKDAGRNQIRFHAESV